LHEKSPEAWTKWVGFFLTGLDEESRQNSKKAKQIIDLYNKLKEGILQLTHSRYAIPLLDHLFDQPIFTSALLQSRAGMPGMPMIMNMLGKLKKAGIVTVLREGRGRRPQVLALAELINICSFIAGVSFPVK
jgi:hypothetical protein